jgi:hypothetical protein
MESHGAVHISKRAHNSYIFEPFQTRGPSPGCLSRLKTNLFNRLWTADLCRDKAEAREIASSLKYPALLMADAKPFWSALFHSVTLTNTEAYEYRRSSIYKNVSTMYRINNNG